MTRPRITPLLLVALVAYLALINALVLTTGRIGLRARAYQEGFLTNDGLAKTYRRMQGELEPEIERYRETVSRLAKLANHHAGLAARYDRARSHPWDAIPPDSPPPP